jgi:hypothetical protein
MNNKIQFLSYYLPQFHPIDENDKWWGKGFTEWTNVVKAKPLFKGHEQPKLPADLGFYDLRIPKIQEQQAQLAEQYGVDGFIYYQYWFGNGKMLLEKPAEAMLKNKNIQLPFCFCWANETWKGIWHGLEDSEILIEQTYNGEQDFIDYFRYLLPFFKDSRYIKIDNKPMFHIYRIDDVIDLDLFIETFNKLAIKEGFQGIYFISTISSSSKIILENKNIYGEVGVDVFLKMRYGQGYVFSENSYLGVLERRFKIITKQTNQVGKRLKPLIIDYKTGVLNFNIKFPHQKYISCVFPNWDNSARSGKKSLIFKNSSPEQWQIHLQKAVDELSRNPENPPFIIIKSWNEWAEGNYLEPDLKYGHAWLKTIKNVKDKLKEKGIG